MYQHESVFITRPYSAVSNASGCRSCLTADPGVVSLIPVRSHIFVEIDHKIIAMAILHLSAGSRMVIVSYKRKYVHNVLVNCLVKLALEKSVVR